MSQEIPSKPTKLCPTCGTRLSEDATRCLVCGTEFTGSEIPSRPAKAVQGSRMPEITLSLPAVMGLFTLFLGIGAGIVFFGLRETGRVVDPTPTATVTLTPTPTITATPVTPTPTNTPLPTPTPISYTVQSGDTCIGIAYNFGVSVQSIQLLNNLSVECSLTPGESLLIPQPTPTPTSLPTATLSAADATEQACDKAEYTVQDGDTLSTIANAYNVPMAVIREYNGLSSDVVFSGMSLTIPLCQQRPTPGPSPTPTPPPPYPGPNPLLPSDGATVSAQDNSVTLQWASVGTLAENEAYQVTVTDITAGADRKLVDYVTDTKFIVPASLRPNTNDPHAFRWTVMAVRQAGTDDDGKAIWESAGATSTPRIFVWSGPSTGAGPTPAP
jgi:LysM repeat protein